MSGVAECSEAAAGRTVVNLVLKARLMKNSVLRDGVRRVLWAPPLKVASSVCGRGDAPARVDECDGDAQKEQRAARQVDVLDALLEKLVPAELGQGGGSGHLRSSSAPTAQEQHRPGETGRLHGVHRGAHGRHAERIAKGHGEKERKDGPHRHQEVAGGHQTHMVTARCRYSCVQGYTNAMPAVVDACELRYNHNHV